MNAKTPHTRPGIPQEQKYLKADDYIAKLEADLIATQKELALVTRERDNVKGARDRSHSLYIKADGELQRVKQALALRGEPVASSACPMDGIDMPHGHTVEAVAAYLRLERDRFLLPEHRDAIAVEVRGCPDGWVLLPLKMTAEMIRAVDETLLRSGEGNEEHVQRHFNSLVRAAPKDLTISVMKD